MGRNGSGKTTLLKVLAGLLSPLRGRVTRQGTVAYVPQDADTLLYAPTVREEVKDHPGSMLPLGVADWLHRYPRDLSTGERQRVAIAAAAGRADVVLLDEPTRGLDPDAKRSLAAYLRVRADAGASILIATHDVEWAARAADRVALMSEGAIYAEGAPRAVLTDSLVFATQVNKLLGKGWLLPDEVPLPSPA
jgi:energy-coupling factor transport system ATP-binding protein